MYLVVRPNVAWVKICISFPFEDSIHFFKVQLLLAVSFVYWCQIYKQSCCYYRNVNPFYDTEHMTSNTSNLMTVCREIQLYVKRVRRLIKEYCCKINIYSLKMCSSLFRSTNYFLLIAYKFDVLTRCVYKQRTEQRSSLRFNVKHWNTEVSK